MQHTQRPFLELVCKSGVVEREQDEREWSEHGEGRTVVRWWVAEHFDGVACSHTHLIFLASHSEKLVFSFVYGLCWTLKLAVAAAKVVGQV